MNLYFELLKKPIFNMEDVNVFYNNMDSARSAIKRLMKGGMVVKIRNNMYTCISGETGAPIANRFQIASHITPTSYVSHHTAMEYYGITNQVFYEVYVSSKTSFRNFTFDGYTYCFVASKNSEGIEKPSYSGGIAVTNLERTLVDSIKDMDKISGIEEVVENIESVHRMQEKRLLKYLELYKNQFLYQKMGYLLWQHREEMGLSDFFFEKCKKQIGKSKRYLTRDQEGGCYDDNWKLVVPDDLQNIKNGGMIDADI
ncbi:MAG: type IV toxin-antitoxin system AbiEi family antitoxin [Lachnospiraceae bacterium]|nr:type IV toxin-antitoxin system AbiEi family antitoxin [Lachnospiraceae bacterium]